MSLQAFWSLVYSYPAQSLNGLALFFAAAGGWLLVATRYRQQRALARLLVQSECVEGKVTAGFAETATQRVNRFFYCFGFASLALALAVSWASTQF